MLPDAAPPHQAALHHAGKKQLTVAPERRRGPGKYSYIHALCCFRQLWAILMCLWVLLSPQRLPGILVLLPESMPRPGLQRPLAEHVAGDRETCL